MYGIIFFLQCCHWAHSVEFAPGPPKLQGRRCRHADLDLPCMAALPGGREVGYLVLHLRGKALPQSVAACSHVGYSAREEDVERLVL